MVTQDIEAQIRHLGMVVGDLVHRTGTTLGELSLALGNHEQYVSRALRGVVLFKVELVYEILQAVQAPPEPFFSQLYPFAEHSLEPLRRRRHPAWGELMPPSLERDAFDDEETPRFISPEEETRRVGRRLGELLARRGITQLDASQAIGLGPRALGQALRGASHLYWSHVFAVVDLLGMPMGRLWKEVYGPIPETPLTYLRWQQVLDAAETSLTGKAPAYYHTKGRLTRPRRRAPRRQKNVPAGE